MPDAWTSVLERHNLMWIGAENSGNEVHVARRVGMALLAVDIAREQGVADRVLLSGFGLI